MSTDQSDYHARQRANALENRERERREILGAPWDEDDRRSDLIVDQRLRIAALESENARLRKVLEAAKPYVEEAIAQHCDKEDAFYNECEIEECAWCEDVRAAIDAYEASEPRP